MAESVLQQPPVPVPIVAVQGGGGITDSVLPQPVAGGEVPILPVQGGGGNEPSLEIIPFRTGTVAIQQGVTLSAKNVSSYVTTRDDLWGKGKMYKWENKAFTILEKELHKARLEKKNKVLGEENIHIFFISSVEQLARIKQYIFNKTNAEEDYIFILIDNTSTQAIFSEVGKQILQFIWLNMIDKKEKEQREIYFLFDRPKYDLIKGPREKNPYIQDLLYLEPTYITIPFKKGTDEYKFIITASKEPPTGVTDKYILLTSNKDSSVENISLEKHNKIFLNTVTQTKITVPAAETNANYIYLEFGEPPVDGPRVLPAPPVLPGPAATPAIVATPAAAAPPASPVTPAKPAVKPYLIQLRPEVTIDIGGNIFTIQKPTAEVMTAWKAGTFSESETAMFNEIGINEDFLKAVTQRKQKLLDKRAGFLQNLVLNQCFKAHNIRYECDMVREFLQELLELKQIERLNKITRAFTPTEYNITLGESLNNTPENNTINNIEKILGSLFTVVPTVKTRRAKIGELPGLDLAGFISPYSGIETLLSGKKAPTSSTKLPIPTGTFNFSSFFSSSTPAVAFSPGVAQTRKKTAGGAKNTTRRRRTSAKS
jgi:hypothetical protein